MLIRAAYFLAENFFWVNVAVLQHVRFCEALAWSYFEARKSCRGSNGACLLSLEKRVIDPPDLKSALIILMAHSGKNYSAHSADRGKQHEREIHWLGDGGGDFISVPTNQGTKCVYRLLIKGVPIVKLIIFFSFASAIKVGSFILKIVLEILIEYKYD